MQGVDDGESWSEGSRSDEVVFVGIPPGTYYLAIDPDFSDEPRDVHSRVEVTSGSAGWSNFVLVLLFLAIFPIFTRLRRGAFEVRRWAESDHAPVASDDSDDEKRCTSRNPPAASTAFPSPPRATTSPPSPQTAP